VPKARFTMAVQLRCGGIPGTLSRCGAYPRGNGDMVGRDGRWGAVFERARRTVEGWSPAKRAWARRATTPRVSGEAPCPSRDACHEAQTCLGNCRIHAPAR